MSDPVSHHSSAAGPADGFEMAEALNRDCFCHVVDRAALQQALESELAPDVADMRQHLFSDTRVYVAQAHLDLMERLIGVVERLVTLPAWQERVLAHAPEIARHAPKAAGVFLGYDFHLEKDGPRLIEINTNAGGGLLNAKLLDAQRDCCPGELAARRERHRVEQDFVAMFRNEWALARGEVPLTSVAIVDESPAGQFLALEFELFRRLFEVHGIAAWVVAPEELRFDGKCLKYGQRTVDFVYNRLTDFALENPLSAPLRDAYLADAVVLTPHPRAHALYADKRNLIALSDDEWLGSIGLDAADRDLLRNGVPGTEAVTPGNAPAFWTDRRQWFFKPAAGYGSRGTYRGDKLTRRVFGEIAQGGFIAQRLVPPSERRWLVNGEERSFKLDLRNYAYRGEVQLVSARLYQGQATNFRTRGGGFAAVFAVGEA